ncbi:imidazole glycerol phosphate synthase subunit HisH [Sphingomonas hankookensis]|uniref:Imidazole glycerol phosphate synthase subunit HisH n=1 Tax=Sphingomonas hengshuiensis TaxID=1609977 RepID=A0A2W4ZBC8_9SPHN|nr:MAG: imidazole glycerol phosphate synthase subunit HisH [Sphingomonas hengshuiensis]
MKKSVISIVDYGQGNLGSIRNMLHFLGFDSQITSDVQAIATAEKLILPGVGAFDTAMRELEKRNLPDTLHRRVVEDKVPILGICLGAQLMTRGSEEGERAGLGWFDAETVRFDFGKDDRKLPIPNIGWRPVKAHGDSDLMQGWHDPAKFYFVHSYYMRSNDPSNIAFTSSYGHDFVAGMQCDNIYSAQFHPEKSHKFGMHLMRSFANV